MKQAALAIAVGVGGSLSGKGRQGGSLLELDKALGDPHEAVVSLLRRTLYGSGMGTYVTDRYWAVAETWTAGCMIREVMAGSRE